MDPVVNAALSSWNPGGAASFVLLFSALLYLRGWLRGRRLVHAARDGQRLAAFLGGLMLVFLATESPLDAFDNFSLAAHMAQHLLLMMFAPPLILLARPTVPLLRGLPKTFVKEGLGPFLTWPLLRGVFRILTAPPFAWAAFAISTIFWHLPAFYELALGSRFWHGVQHASFFWTGVLFWWPVIQPGAGKSSWAAWIKIPYLLFADIVNTALSAFFVFSGRLLYPSYASAHLGSLSPQDDQTIAGLIMWVPGSLVYLLPAFVLAMRLLVSGRAQVRAMEPVVRVRNAPQIFRVRTLARWRPALQVCMLLLAVVVIVDGFFGPQVTPLNLAGVLPWIHWRALSILALLVVGNLFCMSCPFVFVRDLGRKVLPARLRWPRRLRNKWLATGVLAAYLIGYEVFGFWDSPWLTAWIAAGYFAAAVVVDGFFRGASFCKYVCPIGQFQFVSSLGSPREVKVKRASVCRSCQTYDCIRGNEQQRGCELYLFQPKKAGNLDCTFCLDCVKACPHDNVAILPVLPAKTIVEDPYRSSIGRLSKRSDFAALALVFVFGAFANAAGMIGPVMMFEQWLRMLLLVLAVVAVPAIVFFSLPKRFVFALVPMGVAMWAAHLLYHFATGWNAPWTILSQRFLGAHQAATAMIPDWLTGAQILLLDAGLLVTLYVGWRVARKLTIPWAALAVALYTAGIWILFQPMQMRGMVH